MNLISFKDYEGIPGFGGFGTSTAQEIESLSKALVAGTQRPPASGGSALRVESLEATLRITTFTLQNIKFWKKIPKLPAFSTVEEYNTLDAYGADAGMFTNEGELPQTQDSTYTRHVAIVKFLGTTRQVSHPMTLVRPAHGNVIALETQNGAVWLVERLERALFKGRSDMIPQSFDGIEKQFFDNAGVTNPNTGLYTATSILAATASTLIIDKRQNPLLEDDIEAATNFIVENFGVPTDLYLAPRSMSDLAKAFYPRERVNLPAPNEGRVGLAVTSYVSNAGLVEFDPDVFLRSGRTNGVKSPPVAALSPNSPNPPTFSAAAPGSDSASMFFAADAATYTYQVTAVNRFGESAPAAVGGSTVMPAGDSVVLTVVDGGGANPASAYNIYRANGSGPMQYLTQVIATNGVAGAGCSYTDRNWFYPSTSMAYLVQNNLSNFSFRQLAPMMKIPLATIDASIRWMQLLYGVPIVYTPRKNVLFLNVLDE